MVSHVSSIDTDHEDMIHDAQLDYYGKRLATCSSDRLVKLFDVVGDQQTFVAELRGHEGPVWELAWAHPSFGNILASCSYDRKVIIWKETANGWVNAWEHKNIHDSSINSISWCPYEYGVLSLACASSDGDITILSCVDGEWSFSKVSADKAHATGVTSVSWAPAVLPQQAGASVVKRLVSGGCDNAVRIWTCVDDVWQESPDVLSHHTDWVRDVAWAPSIGLSSSTIASCSQDGTVVIWTQDTAASGTWQKRVLRDFQAPVWRVSWSVTGNVLAVSASENKVTLWKESLEGDWTCLSEMTA
eukprot:m.188411 g.188411  ORF g.188411 m.188411 type:complete len:302 (-) comp18184_c2_seq1:75-980(-)